MAAIGGSIQDITLRGRTFAVASDADTQRRLGGKQNALEGNGDGSQRLIQTVNGWSITGIMVEVDDSRGDQEYLQELADTPDFFPITVTYASGKTYQGRGQIVDEMVAGNQAATASVSLSGPGRLTLQS